MTCGGRRSVIAGCSLNPESLGRGLSGLLSLWPTPSSSSRSIRWSSRASITSLAIGLWPMPWSPASIRRADSPAKHPKRNSGHTARIPSDRCSHGGADGHRRSRPLMRPREWRQSAIRLFHFCLLAFLVRTWRLQAT